MKNKYIVLFAMFLSAVAFSADNLITDGKSGNVQLVDASGNRWRAQMAFTTDGMGDIFTLGDVASTDNIIGQNPSGNRTLVDSLNRYWNASVVYTTDGSGHVIPVPVGGGGGGGVSSVTASAPLASSGGSTPNLTFTELLPVATESVYVSKAGNDSTGNGSYSRPYLTIGKALTSLGTSTCNSVNTCIVHIDSGSFNETGLQIPAWVYLSGSAQQPTKIDDSSGAITIASSGFSSGSERIGLININTVSGTGLTVDFQAAGGSGSDQLYVDNCQIVGPVIIRGRGSDATTWTNTKLFGSYTSQCGQDYFMGGYFNNSVTYNTTGVSSVGCSPEFVGTQFFSGASFTSSGAGNTMTPTLISSQVSGTLTIDQATTNLSADDVSVASATVSQTNSGVLSYLESAKYMAYTPTTSSNWNSTPATTQSALDQLAASQSPTTRYVDLIFGSDSNSGAYLHPWKTMQHACTIVAGLTTFNEPYTIHITGGTGNDTDTGTVTCPANVAYIADSLVQLTGNWVLPTSGVNDNVTFQNLIFLGSLTWLRNDIYALTMNLNNVVIGSGLVFKQAGSGAASIQAIQSTFVGMDVQLPTLGSFFFSCQFTAASVFEDVTSAAYYQIMGGYIGTPVSFSGAPTVYFSGVQADVPYGYTLTAVTTGNGSPTFQGDSSSIPPVIVGTPVLVPTTYTPQGTAAQQPACTASIRGLQWLTDSIGGVADIFQICQQTISGFAWVTH